MKPETRDKLNILASLLSIILIAILGIAIWTLNTPQPKEILECQSNQPIITAFKTCLNTSKNGCIIVSADSLNAALLRYSNNISNTNWSAVHTKTK